MLLKNRNQIKNENKYAENTLKCNVAHINACFMAFKVFMEKLFANLIANNFAKGMIQFSTMKYERQLNDKSNHSK